MVIHQFYIMGTSIFPSKNNAKLGIYQKTFKDIFRFFVCERSDYICSVEHYIGVTKQKVAC